MNRETTKQRLVFADCAINIDPTAQELAEIAVNTADTAKIFDIEPKIAMLSFSTKGSAKAPQVEKVQTATKIAKETRPDILLDGELQFDAAFISISIFLLICFSFTFEPDRSKFLYMRV